MTDFMHLHKPGLGNAPSYTVSSIPFVSSSISVPASGSVAVSVSFPQVTKFITIKNLTAGTAMRLGFSDLGIKSSNYYIVNGGEVFTTDVKVTSIYLMGHSVTTMSASLLAGLTHINRSELPNNWSGSLGVG